MARRGRIIVTHDELVQRLKLPNGTTISTARYEYDTDSLVLEVRGPEFHDPPAGNVVLAVRLPMLDNLWEIPGSVDQK